MVSSPSPDRGLFSIYIGVQAPKSPLYDLYSSMNFPLPIYMLVRALQLVTSFDSRKYIRDSSITNECGFNVTFVEMMDLVYMLPAFYGSLRVVSATQICIHPDSRVFMYIALHTFLLCSSNKVLSCHWPFVPSPSD